MKQLAVRIARHLFHPQHTKAHPVSADHQIFHGDMPGGSTVGASSSSASRVHQAAQVWPDLPELAMPAAKPQFDEHDAAGNFVTACYAGLLLALLSLFIVTVSAEVFCSFVCSPGTIHAPRFTTERYLGSLTAGIRLHNRLAAKLL